MNKKKIRRITAAGAVVLTMMMSAGVIVPDLPGTYAYRADMSRGISRNGTDPDDCVVADTADSHTEQDRTIDVIPVRFSHSCSFGKSPSINYYIPVNDVKDYENYRLIIEKQIFGADGSPDTWKKYSLDRYSLCEFDGVRYYCFSFGDMEAIESGDTVRATLSMEKDGRIFYTMTDEVHEPA